jgi:acyl-CoA synthetase (NDP forming)
MAKLTKNFFDGNEILFIGYSTKKRSIARTIFQTMVKHGIKVYPMNNKKDGKYDTKVYKSFEELPKVPRCAYILLNKDNSQKIIDQLKDRGVKKILFQKGSVDQGTLSKCQEMGIETAVGCPLMIYGTGLHKIHAFFEGVK